MLETLSDDDFVNVASVSMGGYSSRISPTCLLGTLDTGVSWAGVGMVQAALWAVLHYAFWGP